MVMLSGTRHLLYFVMLSCWSWTRTKVQYWSLLDGDDEIVWGHEYFISNQWALTRLSFSDPELTPLCVDQARAIREGWETEGSFGFTAPHVRYCSPLIRALHTADFIFDGTYLSRVIVKEVSRPVFDGDIKIIKLILLEL